MAESLSLHTQIICTFSGQEVAVDIIATSPQELQDTISVLTGNGHSAHTLAGAGRDPQPGPTQAGPTVEAAQPQASAPQPSSAPAAAPTPAATPSATETAAQPSQPSVTLNDTLVSARQLLQQPNGEDNLRKILGRVGAESISQADPEHFAWIKYAIDQVIAGQPVDTVIAG